MQDQMKTDPAEPNRSDRGKMFIRAMAWVGCWVSYTALGGFDIPVHKALLVHGCQTAGQRQESRAGSHCGHHNLQDCRVWLQLQCPVTQA